MIDLTRDGDVFTMTLNAGENRWNTTFVRAIDEVLNAVSYTHLTLPTILLV